MASPQQQSRIGRDVAATRKSRTRNWPAQSTQYDQIDSLADYSAAIAGQVQGVGKGMTAGRDLLAYFKDVDNTPRLKYNIRCEHGRSKKQWPHYPHPSRDIIPVGTALEDVCKYFPLHCWADGLRIFMAENWTAEKIFNLLPADARNNGAAVRPWNYLQQAMGREADKMYEEDDNGPRVIPKRKRDEMEGVEEAGNDTVIQTPPEKRAKLTPKLVSPPKVVSSPKSVQQPTASAPQHSTFLPQQSTTFAPQQSMPFMPHQFMYMTPQQIAHIQMNMRPQQMMASPNMNMRQQQIIPTSNVQINPQQTVKMPNMNMRSQQTVTAPRPRVAPKPIIAVSNKAIVPQRTVDPRKVTVVSEQMEAVRKMPAPATRVVTASVPLTRVQRSITLEDMVQQKIKSSQESRLVDEENVDWTDSPYKPADLIATVTDRTTAAFDVVNLDLLNTLGGDSQLFGEDDNIVDNLDHSQPSDIESPVTTCNLTAVQDQVFAFDEPSIYSHNEQMDQDFIEESIVPSIETDADEKEDIEDSSQAVGDLPSGDNHGDTSEVGDSPAPEQSDSSLESDKDSVFDFNDEDSVFEFDDDAFNFVDEDQLQPSKESALFDEENFLDPDVSCDQAIAAQLGQDEIELSPAGRAVAALSEDSRFSFITNRQSSQISHQQYMGEIDVTAFTPESTYTSDESTSPPDMNALSSSGYSNFGTPVPMMQHPAVMQPQMYQQSFPAQQMAHQYMTGNTMPMMMSAQYGGMMQNGMNTYMPQQEYFPQQPMFMMPNQQEKQFHQSPQQMMPAYVMQPQMMQACMSPPSLTGMNQEYGQAMSGQAMLLPLTPETDWEAFDLDEDFAFMNDFSSGAYGGVKFD